MKDFLFSWRVIVSCAAIPKSAANFKHIRNSKGRFIILHVYRYVALRTLRLVHNMTLSTASRRVMPL